MYKLLKINGVEVPDPEGGFTVSRSDKYNEYECEDGSITIEEIRTSILEADVSFKGQEVSALAKIAGALSLVSTIELFDPSSASVKTITAKVTDVSFGKVTHRLGLSIWTLSFKIQEM